MIPGNGMCVLAELFVDGWCLHCCYLRFLAVQFQTVKEQQDELTLVVNFRFQLLLLFELLADEQFLTVMVLLGESIQAVAIRWIALLADGKSQDVMELMGV